MRFKTATATLAMAGSAALGTVIGSWTAMGQTKRAAASIAIVRGADPLEISVKTNGGGVTYFGGVFIEFGDGGRQLLCGPGQGCGAKQLQHRYQTAGKYRVKMVGLGEPDQMPLAEAVVMVPVK